jgi:hypothetical protein
MPLKFKIVDGASQVRVDQIVASLESKGVAARKLFPNQKTSPLARIFAVDAEVGIDASKLNMLLDEFRDDIQYVEGEKKRHPL